MKARLKTIFFTALSAVTLFSAVTYTSCENDKCKSIVCAYGSVCSDGTCLCQTGYEGPQCETITRERYLGPWRVTENGTITDAIQYTVSVEAGDNISEVRIKSFRNLLVDYVSAFVVSDSIYVPEQTVQNYTIVGHGYITDEKYYGDNGKMVLYYKIVDNTTGVVDDFGHENGDPSVWNK